ncbi:MAG: acyl carrier protein [Betaproteobacteria bacterium]
MTAALDTLRLFLAERGIEPERVTPPAELEAIGVDSLLLIEAVFEMEEKLGVRVPELGTLPQTVSDLLAIIDRALAQAPQMSSPQ